MGKGRDFCLHATEGQCRLTIATSVFTTYSKVGVLRCINYNAILCVNSLRLQVNFYTVEVSVTSKWPIASKVLLIRGRLSSRGHYRRITCCVPSLLTISRASSTSIVKASPVPLRRRSMPSIFHRPIIFTLPNGEVFPSK